MFYLMLIIVLSIYLYVNPVSDFNKMYSGLLGALIGLIISLGLWNVVGSKIATE